MFGKAHDKFSKKIINDWEILFAKYLIPFLSKCIAFNIIVLKLIPKSKKTGSTPIYRIHYMAVYQCDYGYVTT